MNHRNYIGADLKWCIGNGRKVHFWTDYWIYMMPLVSFVEENKLQYIINWDAKSRDGVEYSHHFKQSSSKCVIGY